MTQTILTTASIKKITSSKATEIVVVIPSSVSLDQLKNLAKREEFFIALGVSQAEVSDYLEPHRGFQARVDGSGIVQSIKSAEDDGDQMDIEDVESETEEVVYEGIDEESEETDTESEDETESEETDSEEQDSASSEAESEERSEDPDKPLTFVDESQNW